MRTAILRAALAAGVGLAALPAWAEFQTLEGTVAYRERIALPPGALVEVQLVDVSRADAPSTLLGAVTVRPEGQVPVKWQLTYDDAMVSERGRFAVQAKITVQDRAMFRTTQVFPALTQDAPKKVDVMVNMMSEPEMPGLEDTSWSAISLPGVELDTDRLPLLAFDAAGRVSGTSGCNRFNGGVEHEGDALKFGLMAVTNMACPGPMDQQERAVFRAMEETVSYRIDDGTLVLLNAAGEGLMWLKAE